MTPESFRKFFVWLSASVQTASTRLGEANKPVEMPPLPPDMELAPKQQSVHDEHPRQVFLHALCMKTRRPYLMRFARQGAALRYEAIASHPLESLEEGDSDLLPPINSSLLDGCPSCPYCENPHAGACPCGALFCSDPNHRGPLNCPKCRSELHPGGSDHFDIKRSHGLISPGGEPGLSPLEELHDG